MSNERGRGLQRTRVGLSTSAPLVFGTLAAVLCGVAVLRGSTLNAVLSALLVLSALVLAHTSRRARARHQERLEALRWKLAADSEDPIGLLALLDAFASLSGRERCAVREHWNTYGITLRLEELRADAPAGARRLCTLAGQLENPPREP